MKVVKYIAVYPFVVIFDILEFLLDIISNIVYKIKRIKYNYGDIIAAEYISFMQSDFDSIVIYNKEEYKVQDIKYDKVIKQNEKEFKKIVDKLKANNIFKYNRIFDFYITPFNELFCCDGGKGEEILTIYMKNNKKHSIRSSCDSKIFDSIVSYMQEV